MKNNRFLPFINEDEFSEGSELEKRAVDDVVPEVAYQNQMIEDRQPMTFDMEPGMNPEPFDEASLPENQIQPNKTGEVLSRYKDMLAKSRESEEADYRDSSDRSNKMQMYGNLLNSFNNTIKNSMATVVPNFNSDAGVGNNLIQQGKDSVSEFYNKRKEGRAGNDAILDSLSKELDLEDKEQMNDPKSKLADTYRNVMKKFGFRDDELLHLSPKQVKELLPLVLRGDKNSLDLARLEISRINADLRREDIGIKRDKHGLAINKFDNTLVQQDEVTPKQLETISASGQVLDSIDRLESYRTFATGPVSSRVDAMTRAMGADKSLKVKLYSELESIVSAYGKSISGSAIAEPEMKRIMNQLPKLTDEPATFSAGVARFKEQMNDSRLRVLDDLKRSGRNVDKFLSRKSIESLRQKEQTDNKINSFMEKNGIEDREEAISILKKAGKL